ncbi:amidase [Lysinibacillus sp. 2017]|uniref:amidase domain-containing protein n=1 Tax=unclassified Lysinibacillus TaxID=2636778 RepID=UPI000D526C63|nr:MULTISPECIES: amidase domain-containing protein [unclassified Lysinibacillus]AWE06153.1 amidase [Lysinibacillus sp. 2017]TGN35192.1 amidase [Lysinibacillus sp. S2017]
MPIQYDRGAAVAYAYRYWDSFNPAFPVFQDDCTNFISQCLYAGKAPMRGMSNREQGWWMIGLQERWSYSWSVSHSLRWYLETSERGLMATRVYDPSQLQLGDVIFYDFQDNGRIDHSTIVTKIEDGVPYVAAHTTSSINRHFSYVDSSAYTPQMRYYFYHIADVFSH